MRKDDLLMLLALLEASPRDLLERPLMVMTPRPRLAPRARQRRQDRFGKRYVRKGLRP